MDDDLDVEAMLEAAVDMNKDFNEGEGNTIKNESASNTKDSLIAQVDKKPKSNKAKKKHSSRDEKKKRSRSTSLSPKRERRRSSSSSRRRHQEKDQASSKERKREKSPENRSRHRSHRSESREARHSRELSSPDRRRRDRDERSRGERDRGGRERGGGNRSERDRGDRSHDDRNRSDRRERSPFKGRDSHDHKRSPPHNDRTRGRRSPIQTPEHLPIEERDKRTIFCMQLAARIQQEDLELFFNKAGRVREVRLVLDSRSRRHKGMAYIEFVDIDAVGKAIALTGTRLHGVPIVVQHSQAEKNRLACSKNAAKGNGFSQHSQPISGPMTLYVGSLHFNITEEMLKGIFEPFGRVSKIELSRDSDTGRSNGYGFVHFQEAEDAKKALEQLNGFDLAGRPMKVNYHNGSYTSGYNHQTLDSDDGDREGYNLGSTGRLQLMARLAEGTGIELPKAAAAAIAESNVISPVVSTPCFMLSNMFNPREEFSPDWDDEIKNDVIEECRKNGGVVHVHVDKVSDEGYVYVKCASIATANATVKVLNGRWFAGRTITASFVPVQQYHQLFPGSSTSTTLL